MRKRMNRLSGIFLVLLWSLSLVPSLSAAPAPAATELPDPRSMTFPAPAFQPPKPERQVLSNGMILYLLEDHELPLIRMEVIVKTGSIYEPADKISLAGLTGAIMRTGGTKRHSGDEVDEIIDQMAADLSVGIGADAGGAWLDVLKKDFDAGLALFADILMNPVFEEEKLQIAKNNAIEMIRRRNDRPSSIASREFNKQIYGADNPYGREATEETVRSIVRDDLVAFHRKYFAPNNIMIGVTGDFDKKEIVAKIEKAFAGWKKKKIDFPKVPSVVERKDGGVYAIARPITQTQIRIGHLGIKQNNPDFFAVSILDDILGGGGLTSRLFSDVRTQRGLAYSVGSVFRPGNFERGVFIAYGETRVDTTHQAISTILDHIRKIRQEPVTDEELKRAKESFLNSFIFSFSSPAQIVSRKMSLEYYGLPSDFLERYRDNVAKVTQEDILRVAKNYLHPDRLVILAVGDDGKFDQPLSSLGKVTQIQLTP
ncbi:MAG: pitrilysin family protein [Candidatus Manganitrophus sp.]|nr:pitrilysin family protein [Candidatus Manganitrophus sp.]MDC4224672.1 pitrilysin family protein [Candidatus Manganitrophus sp.]WDT70265.1 MAG: pitrilysin family protein [Candidatus Manganitrophus sp.]WDT78079.1 MAG: pitrilysin family protein [Candidatus Manganitrophus sp.]